MWGRSNLPDDLPMLYSYSEALNRYKSTVPLQKGYDQGLVPLGSNRRYKRSQMLKVETRQGNAIICRYWRHNVITFYENGTIHFDIGDWHTPTTVMFLIDVFGNRFIRRTGKIYYIHGTGEGAECYYLNPVHGLSINPDGSPIEPIPEISKTLNRAKWNEVKKRLKPFMDYSLDMLKVIEPRSGSELVEDFRRLINQYGTEYWKGLVPNLTKNQTGIPYLSITPREIKYNRGKITDTRREFVRRVEDACERMDLDAMYPLMFTLQACASEQRWTGNGYISECKPTRIKKYFYELLKFDYCNEVFDDVVQPLGEIVSDSNAKYFVTPRTN